MTISVVAAESPSTAGGAQAGADPEHNGRGERHQGEQDGGPRHEGSPAPGNNGGHGGLDSINEPKSAPDETAREEESGNPGGECYK
jgi:hypothetical protein